MADGPCGGARATAGITAVAVTRCIPDRPGPGGGCSTRLSIRMPAPTGGVVAAMGRTTHHPLRQGARETSKSPCSGLATAHTPAPPGDCGHRISELKGRKTEGDSLADRGLGRGATRTSGSMRCFFTRPMPQTTPGIAARHSMQTVN